MGQFRKEIENYNREIQEYNEEIKKYVQEMVKEFGRADKKTLFPYIYIYIYTHRTIILMSDQEAKKMNESEEIFE